MGNTTNENHDKIWAIVRDAMNQAISINDAVARIKGLQDATELKEEDYEMADNVNPDKAKNSDEEKEKQDEAVQSELAFDNTTDPGEGADADFNDIVGNDTGSDTDSLGVVPEEQVGTGKLEDGVVVAKEEEEDVPEAEVEENTAQENETKQTKKRTRK